MSKLVKRWEIKMLGWYNELELGHLYTLDNTRITMTDTIFKGWVKYPGETFSINFFDKWYAQLCSIGNFDCWKLKIYYTSPSPPVYLLWVRNNCLKELVNIHRYDRRLKKCQSL